MSRSGDRSSDARKRALRLLAREHFAEYTSIYEEVRPAAQTRYQARDLARIRLRYRFPARYLELYAQEQAGPGRMCLPISAVSPGSALWPGWPTSARPPTRSCSHSSALRA